MPANPTNYFDSLAGLPDSDLKGGLEPTIKKEKKAKRSKCQRKKKEPKPKMKDTVEEDTKATLALFLGPSKEDQDGDEASVSSYSSQEDWACHSSNYTDMDESDLMNFGDFSPPTTATACTLKKSPIALHVEDPDLLASVIFTAEELAAYEETLSKELAAYEETLSSAPGLGDLERKFLVYGSMLVVGASLLPFLLGEKWDVMGLYAVVAVSLGWIVLLQVADWLD